MRSLILFACLAGCASVPTGQVIQEAGTKPQLTEADTAIRQHLKRTLRDPDSMKAFAIVGAPELVTGTTAGRNFEQAWLVCAEYNATNAYGGYTGLTSHGFAMRLSGGAWVVVSTINWVSADRRC